MPHPELQKFVATRRQTLNLVTGLSQPQADYKPAAQSWSVAEILDHLARIDRIFRRDLAELIHRGRRGTPAFLVRTLSDFEVSLPCVPDALVPLFDLPLAFFSLAVPRPVRQVVARNRSVPIQAPDIIRPVPGRGIAELCAELESMVLFTENLLADNPDIRIDQLYYYNPLTAGTNFGGLLGFTASHESRHQEQIQDTLANPNFPAADDPGRIS